MKSLFHFHFLLDEPNEDLLKVPADKLLAELIIKHKGAIGKIHEHDTLLEHQVDEEISGNIANGNYPLTVHNLRNNLTFITAAEQKAAFFLSKCGGLFVLFIRA